MPNNDFKTKRNTLLAIAVPAFLFASLAWGVEPNVRTFTVGQKATVQGVIISREGNVLKLRADDDAIGTIDLMANTQIKLKSGAFIFKRASTMNIDSLVPGLHVEVVGKGGDKGDLIADKVTFDPNSMKASRQIDTRVSPLEARAGTLEGKEGALEGRADKMEGRQGQLEDQQHQLGSQVGQVKGDADRANQGVVAVNGRVGDIDNYETKDTATVYFEYGSSTLSADAMKDLDALAQKATSQKGYMLDVEGFADVTGKAAKNQTLSEARANAVIHYLEQQDNIPVRRILAPTGMGTSHEVADNKTPEGRKMNRRVEVKILVSQGLVGGGMTAPADASSKQPGGIH